MLQTVESQAGTSKGRLVNKKVLAPSQTSQYRKTKTTTRQSLQISSWTEI